MSWQPFAPCTCAWVVSRCVAQYSSAVAFELDSSAVASEQNSSTIAFEHRSEVLGDMLHNMQVLVKTLIPSVLHWLLGCQPGMPCRSLVYRACDTSIMGNDIDRGWRCTIALTEQMRGSLSVATDVTDDPTDIAIGNMKIIVHLPSN